MIVKRMAAAIALTPLLLALGACSGSGGAPDHNHGLVVGHLRIPFVPSDARRPRRVVRVAVSVGQRFSVKIDTSDGPYSWSQIGPLPDKHLIRLAGDFGQGSCAPNLAGCRVPYFHTLIPRAKGDTTMTWRYNGTCPVQPNAGPPCTRVGTVIFIITIR